jgi:protein-tyrosine-phosphatase
MVDEFDLILIMDHLNEARILHRFPQAAFKVKLLGLYSVSPLPRSEIPDPYEGRDEDIRRCYRVIKECVAQLACKLVPTGAAVSLRRSG